MYETKRRLSVCWFFGGGFLGLEERCVYLSMVLCVLNRLFDGESENDRRRAGVNVFASSVYVCVCVCVCVYVCCAR